MARRGRPPHTEVLTPREQEVLDLLRRGLTNEQIAERLGISRDGAKFHVSQILSRLGVTTRHEAALWDAATHRPWWKKAMAALPFPGSLKLGAKIAGGAVVASAVAGIALFVWLVFSQENFMVSRRWVPGSTVPPTAVPGVESKEPFWYQRLEEERSLKPRFDVVLNGINIGPTSDRRGGPCEGIPNTSSEIVPRPYAQARGSELEVEPRYLPVGTTVNENASSTIVCRGVIAFVVRDFDVPPDRAAGRFGGWVMVSRWLGEKYVRILLPTEEFEAGIVAGRPAVFVPPTTPEGSGISVIAIAEPFGMTVLQAKGITFEELLRVAESLY
jgi:DNA-binding CsgD family transcriptional regulator